MCYLTVFYLSQPIYVLVWKKFFALDEPYDNLTGEVVM